MKLTFTFIMLSLTALLAGCVTPHPQNAIEFRAAVPGAFLAKVEKYEVSQPFNKVAAHSLIERKKTGASAQISLILAITVF